MLIIDRFAYTNRFTEKSPYIKVGFSLGIIVMSIINSNIYISYITILSMIALTTIGAQIPHKPYIKMLLVPLAYLIISILTIIVTFGFGRTDQASKFIYLKTFETMNFYMGIANGSIANGLTIALRSVSAIVSMYFMILTTPCNQQIKVMKKCKIPNLFIELYVLTYRFIAIFFEESSQIYQAQKMRFGYNNYRNSMKSLSILLKVLFARVMQRYKDMEQVLEMKNFDGNFYID